MEYSQSKVFLSAAAVVVCGVLSAAEITPAMQETISRENLGRREVQSKAEFLVREGNRLQADGEYMPAVKKYIAAIKEFDKYSNGVIFRDKTEFCRKQIAKCYYAQAQEALRRADELARSNEIEEAIKLCKEAMKYCPEQAEELQAAIDRYSGYRERALEAERTGVDRLLPNHKVQTYQVQVLMEQGRKLIAAGELIPGKRKFEEVLLINPYDADALQCLQAVNDRIGKIGTQRYVNEHRRSISEVEWKYAIPILPESASSEAKNIIAGSPRVKENGGENALHQKLESMIIDRINFNEVTLGDAVKYLRDQSRQLDPNQRAVNIILQTNRNRPAGGQQEGGEGGAAAPAPAANGDQNAAAAAPPLEETLVNLDIRKKPLLKAIQELCKVTKLAYRIDDYAVVIARPEEMSNDMRTRLFPIMISDQNSEAIKKDLISNGVKFPPGSNIFYDSRISRMVATNTIDNLKKIEEVIHELFDNQEPMIQLQLKFIEITQKDLDELAFNWQLAINSKQSYYTNNGELTRTAIVKENSNELLRYYYDESVGKTTPVQDSTYTYIWENRDGTKVTASMFALDWADSGDVLASPRITTLSGQEASVQMTETHYYPSSWETMDTEQADDVVRGWVMQGADPQPTLDNEQELGVTFTVRPVLEDKERRLIRVPISFPIKSFSDWMVFDARTVDSGGSVDGEYYKMPILNERNLSTEVLIYDGETIVLGGIAQDSSTIVNDKIPILGDIPLIGRLFRSKYNKSEKTNLLIFMTCRLVKPDGTAFYPDEEVDRGLPKFGRMQ